MTESDPSWASSVRFTPNSSSKVPSAALFEVLKTPVTAHPLDPSPASIAGAAATTGMIQTCPRAAVSQLNNVASPTLGRETSNSMSSFPSSTKKKRPPSLFASFADAPSASPQCKSSTHLSPSTNSSETPQRSAPALSLQPNCVASTALGVTSPSLPPAGDLSTQSTPQQHALSPPMNPHHGPVVVSLTHDRRILCVGKYRVSSDGCLTLRSHLLVNSFCSSSKLSAADCGATPPLRSTLMGEPLSPIAYTIDALPMLPPATGSHHPLVGNASLTSSAAGEEHTEPLSHPALTALHHGPADISPELGSSSHTIAQEFSPVCSAIHRIPSSVRAAAERGGAIFGSRNQSLSSYPATLSNPWHYIKYTDLVIQETPFEAGASGSVHQASMGGIGPFSGKMFAVKRIRLNCLFPTLESESALSSPTATGSGLPAPNDSPMSTSGPQLPLVESALHHANILALNTQPRHRQMHSILHRELQMLHSEYRSAHVVKVYNAFFIPERCCLDLVMEFMDLGCLDKLMRVHLDVASQLHHSPTGSDSSPSMSSSKISSPTHQPLTSASGGEQSANTRMEKAESLISEQRESISFDVLSSPSGVAGTTSAEPPIGSQASSFGIASAPSSAVRCAPPALRSLVTAAPPMPLLDNQSDNYSLSEQPTVRRMPLPERVLAIVAEQVLRGIHDMHQRGHVHRDIKPQNILVNMLGVVKLSDFGLLESLPAHNDQIGANRSFGRQMPVSSGGDESTNGDDDEVIGLCSGTDKYMSPERQRGEPHGKPSDIWSLGVTLAECALGKYPVDLSDCQDEFERMDRMTHINVRAAIDAVVAQRKKEEEAMQLSMSCSTSLPSAASAGLSSGEPGDEASHSTLQHLSEYCVDFIQQCLAVNPAARPTALELQKHKFLNQWKDVFDFSACIRRMQRSEHRAHVLQNKLRARQLQKRLRDRPNVFTRDADGHSKNYDADGLRKLEEAVQRYSTTSV